MTPIFSIPDNCLTDDELAALTAVIAEAQTHLELEGASLAPSPLPSPAVEPAAAAGNVIYF